jgi:hydrogenase maturation protease
MWNSTNTSLETRPKKDSSHRRILVLGLGNVLLKDEGIGVHVAWRLQGVSLPENVDIVDGGTAALDALLLEPSIERLIIIDALRAGREAGTVYKIRLNAKEPEKLERIFSHQVSNSLHQMGLIDALVAANKMNCAPDEIIIIGVEPKKMDLGLELTDEVQRKIPEIIDKIIEEIADVNDRE